VLGKCLKNNDCLFCHQIPEAVMTDNETLQAAQEFTHNRRKSGSIRRDQSGIQANRQAYQNGEIANDHRQFESRPTSHPRPHSFQPTNQVQSYNLNFPPQHTSSFFDNKKHDTPSANQTTSSNQSAGPIYTNVNYTPQAQDGYYRQSPFPPQVAIPQQPPTQNPPQHTPSFFDNEKHDTPSANQTTSSNQSAGPIYTNVNYTPQAQDGYYRPSPFPPQQVAIPQQPPTQDPFLYLMKHIIQNQTQSSWTLPAPIQATQ
jgi:hypothetical protein